MKSSTIHDNINYPLVDDRISRLRDIQIIFTADSLYTDMGALYAKVNSNKLKISLEGTGIIASIDIPNNTSELEEVHTILGVIVKIVWSAGDESIGNTNEIQIEPCKIIWLNRYRESEFVESLNTGTGLGFIPGEGLTVEGDIHKIITGNPSLDDIPAPKGLYCINGQSTKSVDIVGSASVNVELEEEVVEGELIKKISIKRR